MSSRAIMSKTKIILLLAVVAIPIMALTACTPGTRMAEIITGSDVPDIEFVIPQYYEYGGLGITGEYLVPVMVEVSGFELVDKLGQANVPGEGHIHYFLDVRPPSLHGKELVTGEGFYGDTHEVAYYWPNIGLGEHTFWAELVNNDHTSLDPPVVTKVTILASDRPC